MMDRKVFCHITFDAEKGGFKSVVRAKNYFRLMLGNGTGGVVRAVDRCLWVVNYLGITFSVRIEQ